MGLARCRVDHDLVHVWFLECIKNSLEMALVAPVGESLINVIPVAEKNGQITPRRAGRPDPKERVQEASGVTTSSALARWNMWLDEGPFSSEKKWRGWLTTFSEMVVVVHHHVILIIHASFTTAPGSWLRSSCVRLNWSVSTSTASRVVGSASSGANRSKGSMSVW